jgi:hypothetical protein
MPVHHNNGTDDPLVYDVQSDFSKGQVSNTRANLLTQQQGARLRNVVLDYNGVLESRRGFRSFGTSGLNDVSSVVGPTGSEANQLQGLHYYDTLGDERLVAAASGQLYSYDGSTWSAWTAASGSSGSLATAGNVYFTQIADKLYYSDGASGSNIYEWDGVESEADADTAALGLRYIVSHGFRIFGAANYDEIWCSKILPDSGGDFLVTDEGDVIITAASGLDRIKVGTKDSFGSNSTFRVGQGDGDKITALVPWSDFNLIVGKESSIYAVNVNPAIVQTAESTGTGVAQFIVRTVSTRVGCVSHRSAVQVDNDCFFLSRDGVRSIARTIQDGTQGVSPALSYPIDDVIRRINWSVADIACGAYWNGKYLLAVPLDGSLTNNAILVFDTRLGAWYYWDGVSVVDFCVTKFDGAPQKLVALDNGGNVLELRDWFGFEQTSPSDYSDLLVAAESIEAPANVAIANGAADASRGELQVGDVWNYKVSFSSARGETKASAVKTSAAENEVAITFSWDAPSASGLTGRIWGYFGVGVPGPTDYTLLTEVDCDVTNELVDNRSSLDALADQNEYSGERPKTQDEFGSLVEARPTWQVRTRAFTFGEPVSPKKPNHLEMEFDKSSALIDLSVKMDDSSEGGAVATKIDTGGGFLYLPFIEGAKLGDGKIKRLRYNLDNFDPAREIQAEINEASNLTATEQTKSKYLRLREVNLSAFLETMEDQI